MKEEVVATFALLAADADIDVIEQADLRQLAKKLSGVGLRDRWRTQSGAAEAGRAGRQAARERRAARRRTRGHG